MKEESEKTGLKLNIQKTKIMAFSLINSWYIDGGKMETKVLYSWAPKSLQMMTAAMKLKDTCSFGRKAMINLDSVLKSRDISLPTKICIVKAKVYLVVMYRCESWITRKAEH